MMIRGTMMAGVAAVAGLGFAGAAEAVSVNYQVGAINVDAYGAGGSNDGLHIQTNSYSPSAFTLDDGESHSFKAFDIWTPESSISFDDLKHKPISVEMSFSAPGGTANLGGQTFGTGIFVLFGFITEQGHVTWNGPAVVDLGSVVYQVALSNESFQWGAIDLADAYCNYATVSATVTQVSSVPTPAAAAIGLTMFGGMLMKRRKA